MRRPLLVSLGSLYFRSRQDTHRICPGFDGVIAFNGKCFSVEIAGVFLVLAVASLGILVLWIVLSVIRKYPFKPLPPRSSRPSNLSTDNGRHLLLPFRDRVVASHGIAMRCVCCVIGYGRIFEGALVGLKTFTAQQLEAIRVCHGEMRRKILVRQMSIPSLANSLIPCGRKTRRTSLPPLVLLLYALAQLGFVAGDMLLTSVAPNLVGGTPFTLNWSESNTVPLMKDLVTFFVTIGVGDNSGENATVYLWPFDQVAINSTGNVVGPMSYQSKTGVPSDLGPDASTYFFSIRSQLRQNMSVEIVNFSDHFSLTGMNGTFDTPETAIITRPYSPPSANRIFLCNKEPCEPSVALDGLALSSPTSTSTPPSTPEHPILPAWSIVLIIVAVGWLLGFAGFLIYRRRHPFRDGLKGSSRPAKWWNKLPLPKFGASELPAGQGEYNSAELAGSSSNPIYELPAETIQRDIHYHGIPRKDTSEIGVLETSDYNSAGEQPGSPAQSECADTAVTFEVSISRENGDATLTFRSPSPERPASWRSLSPANHEDISPHESTPMLSPNLVASSPVLAPTPPSPTNEAANFTLPEISISPPTMSPIPSPTIEVANPPVIKDSIDMSTDQSPRASIPPSTFEVESRPKPTIPPRPIRYRRNDSPAKESDSVLPAPFKEPEVSSLTQLSQPPPTPSRSVPPIPPPIVETPSPTTPRSEREPSPPPKPPRPPTLPPRPVQPIPSQVAGNQKSTPPMGEQELAALAGAFAPPPPPPKPKSPPGNWVYK